MTSTKCEAEGCDREFIGTEADQAMRYVSHLIDKHPREFLAKRQATINAFLEDRAKAIKGENPT